MAESSSRRLRISGRRFEDDPRALDRVAVAPGGKGGVRGGDGLPGLVRAGNVLDRRDLLAGHGLGELLALGRSREIAERLVDHRHAVAESLDGRREIVPPGGRRRRCVAAIATGH